MRVSLALPAFPVKLARHHPSNISNSHRLRTGAAEFQARRVRRVVLHFKYTRLTTRSKAEHRSANSRNPGRLTLRSNTHTNPYSLAVCKRLVPVISKVKRVDRCHIWVRLNLNKGIP